MQVAEQRDELLLEREAGVRHAALGADATNRRKVDVALLRCDAAELVVDAKPLERHL